MITDIRLQHFRSYQDASFEFDPGVNIIVGANASGKTNLLESLLVTCLGSSYRAKDAELVSFAAPWARLDAHGPAGSRVIKFEVQPSGTIKKTYEIANQKLQRLSLQKTLPVVLFEPNHLLLMSGGPDLRRDYIDGLLEQMVAGYGTLRRQYRRALAQRNALLKRGPEVAMQLFAWNIRLSELGGQVARHRQELVADMNDRISDLYRSLSRISSATAEIRYDSRCNQQQYSSDMLHRLEAGMELDFARGFTAYGPHRDDVVFYLNGHVMQDTASRGETRTMLLALKVLELDLLESVRKIRPILLLDDVFSELDGSRRRALTEVLKDQQVFITTTDADVVVNEFMNRCNVIALG